MEATKRKREEVAVGEAMPAVTLQGHDGDDVRLEEVWRKQPVVLFYYPKAHTGGCTKESVAFTERYAEFTKTGAEVFGVSGDSIKTNAGFAAKYCMPFRLLSDPGFAYLKQLGLPEHNGKPIKRVTFVVAKGGKLLQKYYYTGRGDVTSHVDEALAVLTAVT